MPIHKILIFSALFTALPTTTYAEWIEIGSGNQGSYNVDLTTIRNSGNTVKMWSLLDYHHPMNIPNIGVALSARMQAEYDCNKEQIRILSLSMHTEHNAQGQLLQASVETKPWGPIPPRTPAENFWKIACGKIKP